MKTSSSMQDWSGPRLVGVGDGVDRDRSVLALADYPDVGRVEEVAAVLRCSKWCVCDLINTGALKSIRLGRAIRVTRRALEELIAV
jgi:excisionase family DNA binding protein